MLHTDCSAFHISRPASDSGSSVLLIRP